jgi:hypothetical protein
MPLLSQLSGATQWKWLLVVRLWLRLRSRCGSYGGIITTRRCIGALCVMGWPLRSACISKHVCVCGPVVGGQPGRRHHYWECPVAQAVVCVMQQQLVGWVSDALQPHHVLCMRCPQPDQGEQGVAGPALHKGLWLVVCLAAINAMDGGRKAANRLNVEQHEQVQAALAAQHAAAAPADQRLITTMLQPAALTAAQQQHRERIQHRQQAQAHLQQQQQQQEATARLTAAKQQAVSQFWALLQDCVVLSVVPDRWRADVPTGHPFLRVVDSGMEVHQAANPAQQGGS